MVDDPITMRVEVLEAEIDDLLSKSQPLYGQLEDLQARVRRLNSEIAWRQGQVHELRSLRREGRL